MCCFQCCHQSLFRIDLAAYVASDVDKERVHYNKKSLEIQLQPEDCTDTRMGYFLQPKISSVKKD